MSEFEPEYFNVRDAAKFALNNMGPEYLLKTPLEEDRILRAGMQLILDAELELRRNRRRLAQFYKLDEGEQ